MCFKIQTLKEPSMKNIILLQNGFNQEIMCQKFFKGVVKQNVHR